MSSPAPVAAPAITVATVTEEDVADLVRAEAAEAAENTLAASIAQSAAQQYTNATLRLEEAAMARAVLHTPTRGDGADTKLDTEASATAAVRHALSTAAESINAAAGPGAPSASASAAAATFAASTAAAATATPPQSPLRRAAQASGDASPLPASPISIKRAAIAVVDGIRGANEELAKKHRLNVALLEKGLILEKKKMGEVQRLVGELTNSGMAIEKMSEQAFKLA